MKGIILAGGAGTRLHPITHVVGKSLQPVYNKPMVFYPLSLLLNAGIEEVLIISTPEDTPKLASLLDRYELDISYAVQFKPRGIAEALLIGENFVKGDNVALILGDNIFYGGLDLKCSVENFNGGAQIFGIEVKDPERYGIVEIADGGRVLSIEEKPKNPRSNLAVPGLYLYDNQVADLARELSPSGREELEITDLNRSYLWKEQLTAERLSDGVTWFDCGTHDSLLEAAQFVQAIEKRTGRSFGGLE